jgi:hypothetical protein
VLQGASGVALVLLVTARRGRTTALVRVPDALSSEGEALMSPRPTSPLLNRGAHVGRSVLLARQVDVKHLGCTKRAETLQQGQEKPSTNGIDEVEGSRTVAMTRDFVTPCAR